MDGPHAVFDEIRLLKRFGYFGTVFPVMSIIRGTDAQASANFSTPFFIADRPYEVLGFRSRWEVAATDGSVKLKKVPNGTAPASGSDILAAAIALTGTANTYVDGVVTGTRADRRLLTGEALSLEALGLLTSLQGFTGAVYLEAI